MSVESMSGRLREAPTAEGSPTESSMPGGWTTEGSPGQGPVTDGSRTRARIIDAALRLFAERGIAAVTIDEIAEASGVSLEVVWKHFSFKEAIRDACDSYVLEWTERLREQILFERRPAAETFQSETYPQLALITDYFVKSLMDGSAAADALFAKLVAVGERYFTTTGVEFKDPRASAAAVCAMKVGVLLLRDHLSRALGVDVRTPPGYVRLNRAMLEIFSRPMLTGGQAEQVGAVLERMER